MPETDVENRKETGIWKFCYDSLDVFYLLPAAEIFGRTAKQKWHSDLFKAHPLKTWIFSDVYVFIEFIKTIMAWYIHLNLSM